MRAFYKIQLLNVLYQRLLFFLELIRIDGFDWSNRKKECFHWLISWRQNKTEMTSRNSPKKEKLFNYFTSKKEQKQQS